MVDHAHGRVLGDSRVPVLVLVPDQLIHHLHPRGVLGRVHAHIADHQDVGDDPIVHRVPRWCIHAREPAPDRRVHELAHSAVHLPYLLRAWPEVCRIGLCGHEGMVDFGAGSVRGELRVEYPLLQHVPCPHELVVGGPDQCPSRLPHRVERQRVEAPDDLVRERRDVFPSSRTESYRKPYLQLRLCCCCCQDGEEPLRGSSRWLLGSPHSSCT